MKTYSNRTHIRATSLKKAYNRVPSEIWSAMTRSLSTKDPLPYVSNIKMRFIESYAECDGISVSDAVSIYWVIDYTADYE